MFFMFSALTFLTLFRYLIYLNGDLIYKTNTYFIYNIYYYIKLIISFI